MRLIDADALTEIIHGMYAEGDDPSTYHVDAEGDTLIGKFAVVDAIFNMPTIQPEIVRCKDCKYARLTNDGSCKYCDIWFPDEAEYMDGDYYCASAERKSNG